MFRCIKTVAIAVTLIAGLLGCSGAAAAKEDNKDAPEEVPLYYKQLHEYSSAVDADKPRLWEYRIQPGESLSEIALRYGTMWRPWKAKQDRRSGSHPAIPLKRLRWSVHEVSEGKPLPRSRFLWVEEEALSAPNGPPRSRAAAGSGSLSPGGFPGATASDFCYRCRP